MIERYDKSKLGYAVCLGVEENTPQGRRWTWEVFYVGHSWGKSESAYGALKLDRFATARVFAVRGKDGTYSVEYMESNHLCILIQPDKCYSSSLRELPGNIDAAIEEMNAAVPFTSQTGE